MIDDNGVPMRLTCPNCSARYEVDDSMIPPEGRDVQCSNCTTTWFQPGRRTTPTPVFAAPSEAALQDDAAAEVEAEAEALPPEPPSDAYVSKEQPREAEPEMEATPPTAADDDVADTAGTEETAETAEAEPAAEPSEAAETDKPTPPRRRPVDQAIVDILKSEADREARLRRGDPEPVETQAEMPLPETPDADNRARRRAELSEDAEEVFADTEDGGPKESRRDLLPDIEEINSTLRATGDRSASDSDASDIETLDAAPRRRTGVRIGFLLVLLIAVLGTLVYANSDALVAAMPGAASTLGGFESAVDGARFWLDDLVRGLAASDG
ncbi:MAG: zinc-ribbon domain-containing protein [Pseudomonadota bacterium]